MTNTAKSIAYKLFYALSDLLHDIDVYEFLNDFADDGGDNDFKEHVDAARAVIAEAKGE